MTSTDTTPAPAPVPTTGQDTAHAPTIDPGSLFRFATAGSVDDGKSTLVGRLLYDAKAILADQLEAVGRTSAERGFGGGSGRLDLALLTDGLRAEREQGITIDVAYRYFATDRRSFVLADCPGHVQYTKNTVTGASTADAVVLLVDARHGVSEQTRRHLAVVALLRVPHVVVAVNKIDLVDYSREVFERVSADAHDVATRLGLEDLHVVPVSALEGDNVVERSERTPWYEGRPLLRILEELPTVDESGRGTHRPLRFPVQYVIRPQGGLVAGVDPEEYRDYRGYAGQIASGTVAVGDEVVVLPSGRRTTVTGIDVAGTAASVGGPLPGEQLPEAAAPSSVTLRLADDIDIARGDLIAGTGDDLPLPTQDLAASVAWLGERPLQPRARVLVKHGTATVQGMVQEIEGKLDLDELTVQDAGSLELNDLGRVRIRTASPLPVDSYGSLRRTGAFLLIDPVTGATLAAGLVRDA
ncbi:sulfate adenylyltransferase subunit 1 [Kocuria dechangensis]|uniref:sulfate adenylyltransferase n=1 Tax=Kocuria dechangensis TaxID=1176249 RepID=A0A917GIY1_9MICC|nr:GTP-binding protein [Kocuria dechangensis]GGG48139.1 sulfate adenylyltransferase subunit 1 [Kocuria dechangensis]